MKRIGAVLVVLSVMLLMQVGCKSAKPTVTTERHTESTIQQIESEEIVVE